MRCFWLWREQSCCFVGQLLLPTGLVVVPACHAYAEWAPICDPWALHSCPQSSAGTGNILPCAAAFITGLLSIKRRGICFCPCFTQRALHSNGCALACWLEPPAGAAARGLRSSGAAKLPSCRCVVLLLGFCVGPMDASAPTSGWHCHCGAPRRARPNTV